MARFLIAAAIALVVVLGRSHAWAGHGMDEGYDCYGCHDLSWQVGGGEPDTSWLGGSSRNIAAIKSAWTQNGKPNGKNVPDEFGCLYCHNSSLLKDDPDTVPVEAQNRMRNASDHFRGKASAHPVGYNLTNMADTNGHLLSTWVSNADSIGARATELDCIDCHDLTQTETPAFVYPQHGKPLTTNPYMLRSPAGFNLSEATKEYDGVCRRCHGSATGVTPGILNFKSTGKNLRLDPLVAHQDGSDTTTNVMKEKDGTLLKTADLNSDGVADANLKKQCTSCHSAHYSSSNQKLFAATVDVSNGSRCADCHFPGDFNNSAEGYSFVKYGHGLPSTSTYASGKNGAAFGCGACHSVNTAHDPVSPANGPKMFNFPPDTTQSRNNKDLLSICKTCHTPSKYTAHTGAGADVGCIDCHDEHSEGVGSTSNRYMIPQYLPNVYPRNIGVNTELSFFQSAGDTLAPAEWDYFVPDAENRKITDMGAAAATGICDNAICHAGIQAGTPPQNIYPLSSFMTSGKHSNGNQAAGSNCNSCHTHTDPAGSWGASAACDNCHADATGTFNTTGSPRTHGNTTESLTTHTRHITAGLIPGGCPECHPHDGKTVSPGTGVHMDGVVNFGGSKMLGATIDYAVMAYGGTCVAVNGCHDSESGEWKNGLNANGDGCADCHAATGKTLNQGGFPPVSNKHTQHESPYVPGDGAGAYRCTDCHGGAADAGAHPGHVNGSITIATSGANVDITNFSSADKTCVNSCHVVGMGVIAKRWTTGVLVCVDCHAGSYVGGDRTGLGGINALPLTGLHATNSAAMTSQNPHDDFWKNDKGAADGTAVCTTCHNLALTTLHIDGTLTEASADLTLAAAAVGFTAGTPPSCSPTGTCHDDGGAWKRWWSATADDNTADECDNCHGMFKGSVGTGDNTWVVGISSRHGAADNNGGLEANHNGSPAGGPCFQCHTADTVGSQTFYSFATQHRDGSIQLNNQNQLNDNGATIGCAGCHAVTGLTADGFESIVMADTMLLSGGLSRWGRTMQLGPVGDCDTCHDSTLSAVSGFPAHGNLPNENDTLHAAHQAGPYITGCDACHTNNGSGGDHNNGTVNFKAAASGGMLDSTLNYDRTVTFANTNCSTVNLCHNSDAGEWGSGSLGTDACVDCHKSGTKLLGNGKAATSGLHVVSATNVTPHDETLATGNCVNCHATVAAAPASHLNNVWEADGAANQAGTQPRFLTRPGMTYTEAAPNSATCSAPGAATGLDGCHSDSGEWSRLWSTEANLDYMALNSNRDPGNAVCNVCHGQYATLNAKGWRPGTSHYTSSDLADKTQENKGIIHTDTPNSAACEDCHAYFGTAGHENGSITFSDGAPTGYTLTLNTVPTPDTRHCSTCHDAQSAESAALTASHTFFDSTAFPGPNGVNHVNGVSEPTGCSGCHGNPATDTMWPYLTATTDVTAYPNRDGNHVKHVTAIMTRLNDTDTWAANPTGTRTMAQGGMTQDDALEICAFCHADSSPNFGHGTHYVSTWGGTAAEKLAAQPADVANEPLWAAVEFKPIWNKAGSDLNADFVATTYTGNVVNAGTSGCNTIDCHNDKNTTTTAGIDFRWYGANTSACIMCHQDITSAVAATTGQTHNAHINAAGSGGFGGTAITCPTCHTGTIATAWSGNTAPPGPPTGGHINGALLVAGSANFTYSASSCGTNLCHTRGWSLAGALQAPYNVNGAASYTWGTGALADCTLCHGDAASLAAAWTAPSTAHFAHLNGSATFGRAIGCGDCHTAANTATHMNGSVTIGGSVAVTYAAAATSITTNPNTFSTCGANACHNDGQTAGAPYAAVSDPTWSAGALADCTLCHQGGTAMATNAHDEHMGPSGTPKYAGAACTDCHSLQTVATHINGSTNFDSAKATYSKTASFPNDATAIGTCLTLSCHNRGAIQSAAWNVGAGVDLACNACHGDATAGLLGSHTAHLAIGKVCTDCHASVADPTHINGTSDLANGSNAVSGEAGVVFADADFAWSLPNCTYTAGNGVPGCHATGNAQWGVPTSADACVECHTDNTTTQVNPNTGLHNGATPPSVSGKVHDETIAGGCEACHTTTPSTAHQNGVLVSNDANLTGTAITTWDDALKTCVTNATCHTTSSAPWAHKWSYPATTGTGGAANACAGCHGDWDNGWNAGVDHRTTAGTQSTHGDYPTPPGGNQYDCYECHVLEDQAPAAYTFTFGTQDWDPLPAETSHHGDGTIQVNANTNGTATLYLQGTFNGATGTNNRCSGCHTSDDVSHQMPDTGWPISTTLTTDTAITADCNGCHGDGDGADAGYSYPDGSRTNVPLTIADEHAGAHQTHVDAIAAGAGISAIGGATCNRCHGGNSHKDGAVDLITGNFLTVSGGADADGAASGTAGVSITCANINCHGNVTTQDWYGDQVAPVFGSAGLITVQDTITGGDLQITWPAATDATLPVRYELFRLNNNTTGNACTDGARISVAANLGALSYLDSGLTDGTSYRYCVQASDGVTPTANTANSQSVHNAPSAAPASLQTDYYLTRNNGTLLWTGNSTTGGTCASATITTVAQVTSTTWPPNGRYGLETSLVCASSSTNNYFRMSATSTAGVYRNLAAFYKLTSNVGATTATLSATGTTIGLRSSAAAEDVRIFLAAVTAAGAHTASTSFGQITNVTSAAMANWTPTITGTSSVAVAAGSRLAMLVRWADTSTTASGNDQVAVDNYNATIVPRVRITETVPVDAAAPAFPGNNSGITAVNAGTGGAATVTWVAAPDAYPSNPVRYTVYGVSSATQPTAVALFTAPNIRQNNIVALSTTVTGLVNGTNYYWFGVRATDAANNPETANTTISTPGVTPSGGGGGIVCGDCHGIPPASGAHAAHVVVNTDYTDCEQCHGVVAGGYTTTPSGTHNNGSVSFVAGITYSNGGTPGSGAAANNDTCLTTICHSPGTGYTSPNYATWGTPTSVDCTDCHYYQLVPTAANAAAYVPPASTSHGDHFDAGKTCTACHPDNIGQTNAPRAHLTGVGANDGAILLDQAIAVADEALVTRTSMAFSDGINDGAGVNNVCTNSGGGLALGCHASGSADWEVAFASTACLSCHTNETTPAVNPSTGLHNYSVATRHDDTLLTGNCINCHSNTATRTAVSSLHQDGALQTAATATFGWNGTNVTSYTRATDSCQAAIACHTDGGTWNRKWTAAVDADPLITDDAATATVCRNCHGSFFTGWNIVVPTDHVNPDADNNASATPNLASSKDVHGECTKCHGWGVGAYTAAMHNGAVHQLQMNSDLAYQDSGATVGQCTTNCHGSFTGATALSMDTNSGWTTVSAAFGGLGCGDCHTGGTRPGAANNSGAHDAHGATDAALVAPGTACIPCHGDNGGLNYTSTAAGSHGIGGVVNWSTSPILTYSTAVRNDTTGTCSGAGACHIATGTGAVNIQWGQTQVATDNCLLCHQGTADVNDYTYTGGAAGTPSAINNTEYAAVGHGSANGNATACTGCHDSSVPHDTTAGLTGTNPFRLHDQDLGTAGLQFSCSYNNASCHLATTATNEAGLGMTYGEIVNHDRTGFASPGVDTWSYTPKCADCHDPHGDGSNVKMIHNDLWDNGSSATMVPTSYPITDNGAVSISFTAPTVGQQAGAGAYAMTAAPFGGICQECHERNGGAVADPDLTSYLDNYSRGANATGVANVSPHPTAPGDCSGCHSHKTAFQPSGCTGCHDVGGPGTTGARSRRAVAAEFSMASHHVQGTTVADEHCTKCHVQSTHTTGVVRVWGNAVAGTGSIAIAADLTTKANQLSLVNVNAHCLSCHSVGVAAQFTGDVNTPQAKAWNNISVGARWTSTATVQFGKYSSSTYNTSPADTVSKAYSPHYAVLANQRGVATTGAWANSGGSQLAVDTVNATSAGTVACLFCHSPHGSNVVTNRSWASGGPTGNVGMLISGTTSRLGAATSAYTPTADATRGHSAEADLCFDCHVGGDAAAKVTYTDFGLTAANPIAGYYEGGATIAGAQGRWGVGSTWTGSFTSGTGWTSNAYKPTTLMGSHFKPATAKANSQGSITANAATELQVLNGNCSACHDPHGADQGATNPQYRVPALKGTWLTSPYKEDRRGIKTDNSTSAAFYVAGATTTAVGRAPRRVPEFTVPTWNPTTARSTGNYNKPPVSGGGYGTSAGSTGQDGYFIDLNTFGYSGTQPAWGNTPKGASRNITNTADAHGTTHTTTATYAGLCMTCHSGTLGTGTTIGSSGQIHVTSPGANANTWIDLVPTKVYSGSRVDTGQPGMHGGRGTTFSQCDPTSFMGHGSASARTVGTFLNWNAATGSNNAYGMYYRWDVIMATQATVGGTQSNYHRFPCSKCHTPHATALPRLMRTNCLETSLNNNNERQAYYDDPQTLGQFTRSPTCHSEDWVSTPWNTKTPWNGAGGTFTWTPPTLVPSSKANGTLWDWEP